MKAIILFSGGLDSQIVIKMIQEQNVEVIALFIDNGFLQQNNEWLINQSKELHIQLEIIDIKETFIQNILFTPKYGYGKNGFNPCLDCHENYIKVAWEYGIKHYGLDKFFIVNGDVVGQRGMSQTHDRITQMNKNLKGIFKYVVRPLSAKLLDPTIPELLGVVDRNKFLAISGKGRKQQMQLIKQYNITEYQEPSGGCLLTERSFSNRLTEVIKLSKFEVSDINIPKVGRHFNIGGVYLIISRTSAETETMHNYEGCNYIKLYQPKGIKGAIALMHKNKSSYIDIKHSLELLLDYGNTEDKYYEVVINDVIYNVMPKDKSKYARYLVD